MKSTPLPISVCNKMQTGFPFPVLDLASVNPAMIASMLFPSLISKTSQSKASNLARILPIGSTSSVVPSICFPLRSIVAIILSTFLADAYIIASQF
ncbi:hypothetical protein D3C72_2260960 [compost metagenome]